MSKRKAIGGILFWHGLRTVAGDVACSDDPYSFSVTFRPCVSRLLAWAEAEAYDMVVCLVENRCSQCKSAFEIAARE
jgi:hypothetical protein